MNPIKLFGVLLLSIGVCVSFLGAPTEAVLVRIEVSTTKCKNANSNGRLTVKLHDKECNIDRTNKMETKFCNVDIAQWPAGPVSFSIRTASADAFGVGKVAIKMNNQVMFMFSSFDGPCKNKQQQLWIENDPKLPRSSFKRLVTALSLGPNPKKADIFQPNFIFSLPSQPAPREKWTVKARSGCGADAGGKDIEVVLSSGARCTLSLRKKHSFDTCQIAVTKPINQVLLTSKYLNGVQVAQLDIVDQNGKVILAFGDGVCTPKGEYFQSCDRRQGLWVQKDKGGKVRFYLGAAGAPRDDEAALVDFAEEDENAEESEEGMVWVGALCLLVAALIVGVIVCAFRIASRRGFATKGEYTPLMESSTSNGLSA